MVEESERLMALLSGQRVDRPPLWEPWFAMQEMMKQQYGNDYLQMAEVLHMAAVPIRGVDTSVHFMAPTERIDQTGVWYGGGALRQLKQLTDRPEPDWTTQVEQLIPERQRCADAGRACWVVLPWCFHAVATSMGLEHFATQCYDRPDFVHEAMQWVERRNQIAIKQVIARVRPDFVLLDGDCAYKTGTMIAPDMMCRFCFDPSRRTVEMISDLNIPMTFHTDGKLDDVIPLLLDLGIRAVHGCERQANDLSHLVETFGDDIVLCGNMDVTFLKQASVDQVRQRTLKMLHVGAAKRRFIAGCNTSPQDYIPDVNYQTMCRTIAEFKSDT